MPTLKSDFSDLLVAIYGSVLDDTQWSSLLDRVVHHLDARAAVLVMQERATDFRGFDAMSQVYRTDREGILAHYMENLAHHEAPAWAALFQKPTGYAYFDTELGPRTDDLDDQPHYRFVREKFGIQRRVAFRLNETPGWFDAIALGYRSGLSQVPSDVTSQVSAITPHLARALEITRAFSMLRARYNAVLAALDRFGLGLVITTPSGEVIIANHEAERILEEHGSISRNASRRLACDDPDATAELLQGIQRASRTAAGKDEVTVAPVRLEGDDDEGPLLLDISPIRDGSGEIDRDLSGAIVFFTDTASPPKFDTERVANLFGLTSAETDVLDGLVGGRTAAEIAELRSTSLNTARSQVRSIYQKTRTSNRVQLLRLILKTNPPILQS